MREADAFGLMDIYGGQGENQPVTKGNLGPTDELKAFGVPQPLHDKGSWAKVGAASLDNYDPDRPAREVA